MPLSDIWSNFRLWGVMSKENWPTYTEKTEDEIIASLVTLCKKRGELIRRKKAAYEEIPIWKVEEEINGEIDRLVLAGDIYAAARAVIRRQKIQEDWNVESEKRERREGEIDKEHAHVGDYIQTLINRLSGLSDDGRPV